MPSGGGGGGGGGKNDPVSVNVPPAGPPRALSSYPVYNPVSYQGMQPGALPAIPGMGPAIASYMPAVNGMMGFGGGIPAAQLIQALMAGYAGVPMAAQPTGAKAPGTALPPTPITPTTPTTTSTTADNAPANPYQPGTKEWRRWQTEHPAADIYNGTYNAGAAAMGGG